MRTNSAGSVEGLRSPTIQFILGTYVKFKLNLLNFTLEPRTVRDRNSLSEDTVPASSEQTFQGKIHFCISKRRS